MLRHEARFDATIFGVLGHALWYTPLIKCAKEGMREMGNYYAEKLNAHGLFHVYDTKIPRIRQYLAAEIDFVRNRLCGTENVLEIAAGYGRIVREIAPCCSKITGIDISKESVEFSKDYLGAHKNAQILSMDLHKMSFNEKFDVILCLQNTLSAVQATAEDVASILSLLTPGGTAFFSTYSEHFWAWRIKWFEEQAEKGCLGKIDYEKTRDGVIVCQDGFRATTQTKEQLATIGARSGFYYELTEVDHSSLFLIMHRDD